MMNRLDRIRRKLDTLSSYDIEECAELDLGIRKHRFLIEPPLPEIEVLSFEERYCISLPPDYRVFITSWAARARVHTMGFFLSLKRSNISPDQTAEENAKALQSERPDLIAAILNEIDRELGSPTQKVSEIHDFKYADEDSLRIHLKLLAVALRRIL